MKRNVKKVTSIVLAIFLLILSGCGGDVDYTEAPTVEGETQDGFANNEEFPKHIDTVISDKVTVDADVIVPEGVDFSNMNTYNAEACLFKESDPMELFEIKDNRVLELYNEFNENDYDDCPEDFKFEVKRYTIYNADNRDAGIMYNGSLSWGGDEFFYHDFTASQCETYCLNYLGITQESADEVDCGKDFDFMTREEAKAKAENIISSVTNFDYNITHVLSVEKETLDLLNEKWDYTSPYETKDSYLIYYTYTVEGIDFPYISSVTDITSELPLKYIMIAYLWITEDGVIKYSLPSAEFDMKLNSVATQGNKIIGPEEALEKVKESIDSMCSLFDAEVFKISLNYVPYKKGRTLRENKNYEIRPVWKIYVRTVGNDDIVISEKPLPLDGNLTETEIIDWTVDAVTGEFTFDVGLA